MLDAIDELEAYLQAYDRYVPELRAWGQSPIYVIAWRYLMANLIVRLHEHEDRSKHLERERNHRLVDDGIRLRDVK